MLGGFFLHRGARKPWEILASFPKGYEVIMENLLHRLTPYQKSRGQGASHRTEISPLIVWRGPWRGPGLGGGTPAPVLGHPEVLGPLFLHISVWLNDLMAGSCGGVEGGCPS